jgi:hypothetical protein
MAHFESFASLEEAMAVMREREAQANAAARPEQLAIGYGDYWLSAFDDFLIFGRVSTLQELDDEKRRLGAGAEERKSEQEMIEGAHARGYRFGTAYSIVEPDGELGSTHLSRMVPISKDMFLGARLHHWDVREIGQCKDCRHWLAQALRAGAGIL